MAKKECKYKGSKGCDIAACPGARHCKAYSRENNKRYVNANRDEVNARANVRAAQHRDEKREYDKEYNIKHSEERKAQRKAYYQNNKDTLRAANEVYKTNNREKMLQYFKDRHAREYVYVGDIKALMHEDGSITRMRSMSEVYFFSMLEEEGVAYEYEVKLSTPMGVYIADGFLPELNIYVEVKADHYVRDDQMAKINYLREQGYSIIMIDSNLIDGEFGF